MQTTIRKADTKVKSKEKSSKDDGTPLSKKPQDEKLKRSVYSVSTPRNYVQKSTTADIYAQKKKNTVQATKAPKKVPGTTNKTIDVSPMKDQLKSSSSSVSQVSLASAKKVKSSPQIKSQVKIPLSARITTPRNGKDLPHLNVTVNSPVAKKKLENKDGGRPSTEDARKLKDGGRQGSVTELKSSNVKKRSLDSEVKEGGERQRTKTRTLNDNEVKVLTPEAVDNNAEMLNLSRRLTAKPKAFYVDLDDSCKEKPQKRRAGSEKSSDAEVDYEDDFESYESDFESPSPSEDSAANSVNDTEDDQSGDVSGDDGQTERAAGGRDGIVDVDEGVKEVKDEEKMLDSGNFDLRDTRSANKAKPAMADIQEDSELDGLERSLPDEGFQDMSSAGCSIRTVHTEVIERPLFIDFTKAKENKRKRKIFERLKQRAKDILSMVTLHEMSYTLFEMKPIPYEVYMSTYGRSNYTQTASQTFDDGISEEIQTEEVLVEEKWTQHPVAFSKHDIYLRENRKNRKYSHGTEDFVSKFTFLLNKKSDVEINNRINVDEDYKLNPLRMYFEQKDGAGPSEMLPYDCYEKKLKNNDFNTGKLKKFLKKHESRISNILSKNSDNSDSTDLYKKSKYPFSKGYMSISTKNVTDEKLSFLKQAKVSGVIFSESKSNLIMTVHKKCGDIFDDKCMICLWDTSIVRTDPQKILVAIDDVNIGRYNGSTDGVFVAALLDGSLHLWDLSEEPTWHTDVANAEKSTNLVEVESQSMTQIEKDREWNLKNSHVGIESVTPKCLLQASSFTTSAVMMQSADPADCIVGLELDTKAPHSQEGGRKLLGQVCSLQRIGILTIWSIIQEKKATDLGKAYWSKMKLELIQTIYLVDHLDLPRASSTENIQVSTFNLNAAKRRASVRRKEKNFKKQFSRQKSAVKLDSDRPTSAATLSNQNLPQTNWESGIICNDLKIMRLVDGRDEYLVGKNCGEVLCCARSAGVFKINRFCVATAPCSVTCVATSPNSLPYFLAATDAGTIHLCAFLESRVLLTLDCRNGPPGSESEKYQVDLKGRYMGSAARPHTACPTLRPSSRVAVKSICWPASDPCAMFALVNDGALLAWDLTHSDIHARHATEKAADEVACSGEALALVASEEVQVHRISSNRQAPDRLQILQKYIALL